ncbi:MAG: hypothetical protein U0746_06470 [Gemmataceae bacterium]
MRLLPRSITGTRVAATVVWVAACAVAWWAIPPRPRVAWTVPENSQLLGYLADGRTLVTQDFDRAFRRVRFWNADTGKAIGRCPEDDVECVRTATITPDKRGVMVSVARGVDPRTPTTVEVRLYEPGSPTAKVLLATDRDAVAEQVLASPNGRMLTIERTVNPGQRGFMAREALVWDCERQLAVANLPSLATPMAFSPDGRWLLAQEFVKAATPAGAKGRSTPRWVVWDLTAGCTVECDAPWGRGQFIPGRDGLLAVEDRGHLTVWDVAANQQVVRESLAHRLTFMPDGSDVLGTEVGRDSTWVLSRWAWATGTPGYLHAWVGNPNETTGEPCLTADGRTVGLLVVRHTQSLPFAAQFQRWTGRNWLDGKTVSGSACSTPRRPSHSAPSPASIATGLSAPTASLWLSAPMPARSRFGTCRRAGRITGSRYLPLRPRCRPLSVPWRVRRLRRAESEGPRS